MLHISYIRENKDKIIERLKIKNFNAQDLFTAVIEKDNQRKLNQQQSDDVLSQLNQIAKQIGVLYKEGKTEEANILKKETALFKDETKKLNSLRSQLEQEIKDILVQIPNVPHITVKSGTSDKDNEILN